MLHGFPESWYSWRHQFAPLAAAGFHAVAPDMRGYGKSDKPHEISAYNQVEVVADIIGLIPALGAETAVVIGHDWGAPTAWSAAAQHPDQVRAVGTLSVPFSPRPEAPPLDMLREAFKGQFFYQLYFQEPGVAEAEFEVDIRTALRKFLFLASGQSDASTLATKQPDDDLLSGLPDPEVLPPWLTEADLDFYTGEFERSGFRGPLNYYRNHNLTWRLTEGAPTVIEQPALFAAGEKDGVILMAAEALKRMPERVPNLRTNELLPGIGHWTQQEAPEAVNRLLTSFLRSLSL
ncbi:MAG: alpha/beta hydrolase [Gammaproteobacteria bacterium]|nr:alpha/beta hydrolase [Gammaproteobacteria bacterium]